MDQLPVGAAPLRWPAEWEPHVRTWIAWPHQQDDWPGKFAAIPWVYAEIVRSLQLSEEVGILVSDVLLEAAVREVLLRAGIDLSRVNFQCVSTDRAWTRDSGPTFVKTEAGGELALDWQFNAWAKYPNHVD